MLFLGFLKLISSRKMKIDVTMSVIYAKIMKVLYNSASTKFKISKIYQEIICRLEAKCFDDNIVHLRKTFYGYMVGKN